jgi:Zn-dependent protease with chaperone function
MARVTGMSIGVNAILAHRYLIAVILVVLLGVLLGGYQARKKIFGESWGIFGYLSHTFRFWLALLGPWILVMFIPVLVGGSGKSALAVGLGIGGIAVVWNWCQATTFPKLVQASPLDRPELKDGFSQVVSRAKCRPPSLYEAGAKGGHWINAFALPSWCRSGVLFTEGLLAALAPAEVTAIFAHEIAHLEHFNRKRLLLGRLSFLLIVAIPIAIWAGPFKEVTGEWAWIWPLGLLIGLLFAVSHHQQHEAQSDARAAELCGNPDALIQALTKIHVLSRISRRWDSSFEKWSTHPSLARRVQNIRRLTEEGTEPFEDIVVRAVEPAKDVVILDQKDLHWLQGLPDEHPTDPSSLKAAARERRSIPYGDLRDLRLEARRHDRHLVFTDNQGRNYRMAVPAEEVARLQGALDRVDSQVKYLVSRRGGLNTRFWAALALLTALLPPWSLPLAVLSAMTLIQPAAVNLAALGAVGLGSVIFGSNDTAWWVLSPSRGVSILRIGIASICLGVALYRYRREKDMPARAPTVTAVVAATFAGVMAFRFIFPVTGELPLMQVHLAARNSSSVVLFLLAAAIALATIRSVKARLLAVVSAGLVTLVLTVGTMTFREHLTEDPFRAGQASLPVQELLPEKVREAMVDGYVIELVLSPSGKRFAVSVSTESSEPYENHYLKEYLLEGGDDGFIRLRALRLSYVDDSVAAMLVPEDGKLFLRTVDSVASDTENSELELPSVMNPELSIDSETGVWQVAGYGRDYRELLCIRGDSQMQTYEEMRYEIDEFVSVGGWAFNSEGWALGVSQDLSAYDNPLLAFSLALPSNGLGFSSELLAMRKNQPSRSLAKTALTLQCFQPPPAAKAILCTAGDGKLAQLWSIEPDERRFTPFGAFSGSYIQGSHVSSNHLLIESWNRSPIIVDLEKRQGYQLAFPSEDGDDQPKGKWFQTLFLGHYSVGFQTVSLSHRSFAVASPNFQTSGTTTKVTIYELPLP